MWFYMCVKVYFAVYERFMQFVVCKLYICENKRYEYVIYKLDGAKHSRVGFKIFNYQCNMSFNQWEEMLSQTECMSWLR